MMVLLAGMTMMLPHSHAFASAEALSQHQNVVHAADDSDVCSPDTTSPAAKQCRECVQWFSADEVPHLCEVPCQPCLNCDFYIQATKPKPRPEPWWRTFASRRNQTRTSAAIDDEVTSAASTAINAAHGGVDQTTYAAEETTTTDDESKMASFQNTASRLVSAIASIAQQFAEVTTTASTTIELDVEPEPDYYPYYEEEEEEEMVNPFIEMQTSLKTQLESLENGESDNEAALRAWHEPDIVEEDERNAFAVDENQTISSVQFNQTIRVDGKMVHPHLMTDVFADVASRMTDDEKASMVAATDKPVVGNFMGLPIVLADDAW